MRLTKPGYLFNAVEVKLISEAERSYVLKCYLFNASHILQIEKNRGDKGGFMSLQSMGSGRIESKFSDMSISSNEGGFGGGSGFGLTTDIDSFSSKSKGLFLCQGTLQATSGFDNLWLILMFVT